jgi:nucleoside-diphosphate-sugar epimerase
MRVFLTGATGFIGSRIAAGLIEDGHVVIGLARNEASAASLRATGARVHHGDLDDLESLRSGAAASDAVVHAGYIHDFYKFKESAEIDARAIEALGLTLAGSKRPLIVSAGLGLRVPGRIPIETDNPPVPPATPRISEEAAMALLERGVNAIAVRLPQVHNTVKQGLVTRLVEIARKKGVSGYVGDGANRWAAVNVTDAASLYRLALEYGRTGAKYHAVGEEGVGLRDIAEAIARGLNVPAVSMTPDEALTHFGPIVGTFVGRDNVASSAITQTALNWHPSGPGMIADLDKMRYSEH